MNNKKNSGSRKFVFLGIPAAGFIAVFIGFGLVAGFHTTMTITSQNEFCYGCHIGMDTVVQEYQRSVHYNNSTGVRANCADCHVPDQLLPKLLFKVEATADIYHKLTGSITLENFDQKRAQLAERVWINMIVTESRACKNCHNPVEWDLASQSAEAQADHQPAQWDLMKQSCIDCHQAVSHKRPEGISPQDL